MKKGKDPKEILIIKYLELNHNSIKHDQIIF